MITRALIILSIATGLCACAADATSTATLSAEVTEFENLGAAEAPPVLAGLDARLFGAWASGTTADACETEQITYFSSDGVVLDLYSKDGAFHSFGLWRRNGDVLEITHNEMPLDATGVSEPEIRLGIVTVTPNRLVLMNVKGEPRERVRCEGLTLRAAPEDKTDNETAATP